MYRVELFNEISTYLMVMFYPVLLLQHENKDLSTTFRDNLGTFLMGLVIANFLGNVVSATLAIIYSCKNTGKSVCKSCTDCYNERQRKARRAYLRDTLGSSSHAKEFDDYIAREAALEFCQDYYPQRVWMKSMGLPLDIPEEKEFIEAVEKHSFIQRRKVEVQSK